MKKTALLFCPLLISMLIILAGCTTRPAVTDFWIADGYSGQQYGKILVIGAAEKITFRNLFEGELVGRLRGLGLEAVPSYEILPYDNKLTREVLVAAVENYGIDSVLITSLADRGQKKVFYSLGGANPYVYYNRISNAIQGQTRSETLEIDILFLQTKLYDIPSEELVWSMTSESEYTYKMKSLQEAISLIIKKLRDDGLI